MSASTSTLPRERHAAQANTAVTPLTVRRQRHWARWAVSAAVLFLLSQLAWSVATTAKYGWSVFADYFLSPAVLEGVALTLWLTLLSTVGGFILGTVLAALRLSASPLLRAAAFGYVWFFRSVPLVVQILVWYNLGYLYPRLGLGTPFTEDFWIVSFPTTTLVTAFAAVAIGLTLHQAAYSAEIIRGGILSVDHGQTEASAALGLPRRVRFFTIILPQAARSILPASFNEIVGQVKGTSVAFIVALPELFYTVQVIYGRNQEIIPLLLVAVVWYALITTVLSIIQYYVERHFSRGAVSQLPPTPVQRARSAIARLWNSLADSEPTRGPHVAVEPGRAPAPGLSAPADLTTTRPQ